MIPTIDVLKVLRGEGYLPVTARQAPAASRWSEGHQRHMIRLRQGGLEQYTGTKKEGGLIPELILVNSSDATTSFDLSLGMWRKICSNGMVVWRREDNLMTIHKNIEAEDIINRARELTNRHKPVFDQIKLWAETAVSERMAKAFAEKVMALRFGDKAHQYSPEDFLAPRRVEDEALTLWNIFNRAQENAMKGGVTGATETGRRVRSRALTTIDADLGFNAALWALAEETAKRISSTS